MSSTASAPTGRRGARTGTRTRRTERHPEGLERLRILLAGAMGSILVGYALLVPVAALFLVSGGSGSLDGSFAIAVPMWLAAHQIPVEVEGRVLGVLPLMPTVVLVVVVAVAAAWSVRRLGGRIRHDGGPVVAGQAGAAAAVAVLAGALLPGDVSVTTPWASMVGAGLLAGLAAGAGVLRACGLPPEWARVLRGRPRAALLGARAAAAGLLLSGTVVVLLGLSVRAGAVADSFAGLAPGVASSAGVLLLAVGYLPNTLVAGAAWSLGPGFAVGPAQFGPFGTEPGPLPPFPLFAAVPTEPVPAAAAMVLLMPVGAGVVAGLVCRRALGAGAPLRERAVAAAASAAVTAVGAAIVAAVAGGSLAGGPYGSVSLSPVGVLATVLVLLGVPATIAAVGVDEILRRPPSAVRHTGHERTRSTAWREERPRGGFGRAVRTEQDDDGDGTGRSGAEDGPARKASTPDGSARTGSRRDGSERTGSNRPGSKRPGSSTRREREPHGGGAARTARPAPAGPGGDGPDQDGTRRDGIGRDGAARRGTARGGRDAAARSRSRRDGSTGRGRPARDDGPGRDGARQKAGRDDTGAGAPRDRSSAGSRAGSSGSGRSRGATARGGSAPADAGDPSERPERDGGSRPRTVGDLVAQQARNRNGPASAQADTRDTSVGRATAADRPDADGAGADRADR